ncbi:MAG TPA: TlyA family RNA methyltransferase [Terriglobales bacterium]|nr:TlyA family RNA methyltransferase [Terriglobales bacterium]
MPAKLRLDLLLVERGLAPSREQAQALILAGAILVNGQKATKPGHAVAADAELTRVGEPLRFASRAGLKLEAALDHFHLDAAGRVALDVGSSTGGFTDCLLQRGARRVHAVDSGTNQMIWRLRTDPRVHLLEKTNARFLTARDLKLERGEEPDLLTLDVSFISATLLLPTLVKLLRRPAEVVVLVKPQFEAGRAAVGKGGVVRDAAARQAAVERVAQALEGLGARAIATIPSPILGAHGNQEFLLHAVIE